MSASHVPLPIFKTSNKMKEMSKGQILEVQSDDDGIVMDMPASVQADRQ